MVLTPEAIRAGSPRIVRSALLSAGGTRQDGLGQLPETTGAANTYATVIDPKPPGGRLIGPEDWKNRMSAGLLMFTKQILASSGFGREQAPSVAVRPPVM